MVGNLKTNATVIVIYFKLAFSNGLPQIYVLRIITPRYRYVLCKPIFIIFCSNRISI